MQENKIKLEQKILDIKLAHLNGMLTSTLIYKLQRMGYKTINDLLNFNVQLSIQQYYFHKKDLSNLDSFREEMNYPAASSGVS